MNITNIKRCARCGKDHDERIEFRKFIRPPEGVTHWGLCPETEEPILLTVEEAVL